MYTSDFGIKITSDDSNFLDLTECRLNCIKTTAVKLLELAGYKLTDEGEFSIHFTTKNENRTSARITILCGPVINSVTKNKESRITFDEYRKLLLNDMQETSVGKNSKETLLESLVDTVIKTSFLQVKANQGVSFNFDPNAIGPRHKSGVFLQYTSCRLTAIKKKYEYQAEAGVYPELSQVENVDFSSLREPEEWSLVFNFLLEYPSLIDRIAKDMTCGKAKLHLLCDFLSKLCSSFSAYYRKTRILLEPRSHLIPIIHARILLAMAIEQTLSNGLAILNVCKIEEM